LYNSFQIACKYLHYLLTASNGRGHGTHSPFVYELIRKVLNDKRHFYAYTQVEQLRAALLQDKTMLDIEDFGAGSAYKPALQRSVAQIARTAAKSPKYARLLYRLVNHFSCTNIIELGTSLGISTAYMAMANSFAQVISCEGSPAIAETARENMQRLALTNVQVITGPFETSYPQALAQMPVIDLLFIDGNHRRNPTVDYFEKALPKLGDHSIVVFDDIHWSAEMEQAWQDIKSHERVSESIDLFFIGIIFLRKEQKVPQHFTIRY
jgi:predicted O-methyltransferase YrrM